MKWYCKTHFVSARVPLVLRFVIFYKYFILDTSETLAPASYQDILSNKNKFFSAGASASVSLVLNIYYVFNKYLCLT